MTSHELARQLLKMEDLPIVMPDPADVDQFIFVDDPIVQEVDMRVPIAFMEGYTHYSVESIKSIVLQEGLPVR